MLKVQNTTIMTFTLSNDNSKNYSVDKLPGNQYYKNTVR